MLKSLIIHNVTAYLNQPTLMNLNLSLLYLPTWILWNVVGMGDINNYLLIIHMFFVLSEKILQNAVEYFTFNLYEDLLKISLKILVQFKADLIN